MNNEQNIILAKNAVGTYEEVLINSEMEMLSSTQKYINNEADTIFIHILLNDSSISIDYFYRFDMKIFHPSDVNEADRVSLDHFNVSKEAQVDTIKKMTEAYVKVITAAKKQEKQIPSEIRLTYDRATNQLVPQYSYEKIDPKYFSRSHQDWFYNIASKLGQDLIQI